MGVRTREGRRPDYRGVCCYNLYITLIHFGHHFHIRLSPCVSANSKRMACDFKPFKRSALYKRKFVLWAGGGFSEGVTDQQQVGYW
jgi:hypothetical protein